MKETNHETVVTLHIHGYFSKIKNDALLELGGVLSIFQNTKMKIL